jgi:hypothetical protein
MCILSCYNTFFFLSRETSPRQISSIHQVKEKIIADVVNFVSNDNDQVHYVPVYASPNDRVLGLLYPQGLSGGYRNQVIKLIGFVTHGIWKGYKYILLESLQCETHIVDQRTPIPFDLLFDIDHWNSFHKHLPVLVDYHDSSNFTCWMKQQNTNTSSTKTSEPSSILDHALDRGFFAPVFHQAKAIATGEDKSKFRALDLLEKPNECKGTPTAYGGGRRGTRLWGDYMATQRRIRREKKTYPYDANKYVWQALLPNKVWRDLAMSCLPSKRYLSIHTRTEMDMIIHRCGKNMEHNLTKVFNHLETFLSSLQEEQGMIESISIATSREKMETKRVGYIRSTEIADENLSIFNRYTKYRNVSVTPGDGSENTLSGRAMYECGQALVNMYYKENPGSRNYGDILPMIVDFHILTEAEIFIGVRQSSFSTDVWMTRYYQGKGASNYEYTPDGIFLIENGGLPPSHVSC